MESNLIQNIKALVKQNGYSQTYLNDIRVFYSQESLNKHKVIYDRCIIIVGQGSKSLYLKNGKYQYDQDNFLIVPATLPLECETTASRQNPFLAVILKIDLAILQEVAKSIANKPTLLKQELIYTSKLNDNLKSATQALLKVLQSAEESDIFANNKLKELYYYLLKESPDSVLYNLIDDKSQVFRINKSLNFIYNNLNQPLLITNLASKAGMSVATYYRHFKTLTGKAPLQLIKETKLLQAKDLLENNNYKASQAALEVGYQNYSQFSREFKKLFGKSPNKIKNNIKYKST